MSKALLQSFLEKASSDKNLAGEVKSILEREEKEKAAGSLVKLGSEQGFEFSAEEVAAFFSAENEKLNDRELDGVAGGIGISSRWYWRV